MSTYSVCIKYNGEEVKKRTDSLDELFIALKPEMLMTEMYVTVKQGKAVAERKLNLVQGRKLFNDPTFREVFINNLLIPLGA